MIASRLLVLDAALLAVMILTSRLALVVHEVGGHALPARLLGAEHVEVRLSPMGGGFVSPQFPRGHPPPPAGYAAFCLGGIALNLLTGLGAWFWARRLKRRGLLYAAVLFVAVGSVAGALCYLACGFYYGSGDPVGFAPASEDLRHVQWIWMLLLAPTGAVLWLGARHFMDVLADRMDLQSPRRRIGALLGTVGLVGLCYGGLWLALRDPRIEGSTRQWRIEREVALETERRNQAAQPPALRSDPAPAPPAPAMPAAPPPVRAEEVADKIPSPAGPLVLYGTAIAGAMLGAARARPRGEAAPVPPILALGLLVVAAAVVTLFWILG